VVNVVYNYIGSDASLDGIMIEGILALFAILIGALVAPYIKDYFNPELKPTGVEGEVHYVTGGATYKFPVYADKAPPLNPHLGMSWLNLNDSNIYAWDGQVWKLRVEPKEGDLWLW